MHIWILILRIFAGLLCFVGGWMIAGNWAGVIDFYRTGRNHSSVPLFGPAALASGLAIFPLTHQYCWIALLIDVTTLWPFAWLSEWYVRRTSKEDRITLKRTCK